jgi:hypothetical protein
VSGTLNVTILGDFLPRHILGRFHVLCAILRNIYLSFVVWLTNETFDVVFVDQVAASVPILRLAGMMVNLNWLGESSLDNSLYLDRYSFTVTSRTSSFLRGIRA